MIKKGMEHFDLHFSEMEAVLLGQSKHVFYKAGDAFVSSYQSPFWSIKPGQGCVKLCNAVLVCSYALQKKDRPRP